ncbi:MAG: cbb3-type cytochrome c oxidase subunit II, partial [Rhodobacteraceae bacterium]|nr:cbb3-type cytochrome c oxidase subunit II [Paracoccaceae bacterium]
SMYDHPFQWGSKRTGPDLARLGGRYSDEWHVAHMTNPRDVVPESVMPTYSYLLNTVIDGRYIQDLMSTYVMVGVPYTDDMIAVAQEDFLAQADPNADTSGLLERYHSAQVRNFDGQPELTEMDALIAYMQMIGTLVDFDTFVRDESR